MGRMEKVWGPNCREFLPERWLDKDGVFVPSDQYRFPVFHCGPRMCLGKEMVYVQMKSIAASVIYGYEIEAVDTKVPSYTQSLLLKMNGGFSVRLKRRSQNRSIGWLSDGLNK
uniref:Uncharacterized protein n=1 Tax=Nelumbo nucifera TaxID=4432 RepID=A0A822ZDM8_NELNU|nr:TPA_asm: hypothetical protein HUJ06_000913 [Nelumbo nucifera]